MVGDHVSQVVVCSGNRLLGGPLRIEEKYIHLISLVMAPPFWEHISSAAGISIEIVIDINIDTVSRSTLNKQLLYCILFRPHGIC